MRPRIVVIGSANMDLVVRSRHIAAPGETVLGEAFEQIPGGKGANQAVAASRLGGAVTFVGRVGRDPFGDATRLCMERDGIDVSFLRTDESEPTGIALIVVDAHGQNAITVAPGANYRLCDADIDSAVSSLYGAGAAVLQLEIPVETVFHAARRAREAGAPVLLNPAPFAPDLSLPAGLPALVDVLVPNEHEAAALLRTDLRGGGEWEEMALALLATGVKSVVITLGAKGCVVADRQGVQSLPACPVHAIDTTAAGDCFTGALAVCIAEGASLAAAARFASRAAAISVTRWGAQPSLPTRAEVERSTAFV